MTTSRIEDRLWAFGTAMMGYAIAAKGSIEEQDWATLKEQRRSEIVAMFDALELDRDDLASRIVELKREVNRRALGAGADLPPYPSVGTQAGLS